mgnify:CR=1 FL=1
MTTTQLTPAQHAILAHAVEHTSGKIDWFPDNIKGGARKKVLDGLFNRALITTDGTGWFVAAEGYDALGIPRPDVNRKGVGQFEANLDRIIANAEGAPAAASDPELEAAHGARHLRRSLQEKARPDHRLGQAAGWRADLPHRLKTSTASFGEAKKMAKGAMNSLASLPTSAFIQMS